MADQSAHRPLTDRAVTFNELTRSFVDLTAVDHKNWSIGAGEIFRIIGPNGAGKSTLIRTWRPTTIHVQRAAVVFSVARADVLLLCAAMPNRDDVRASL